MLNQFPDSILKSERREFHHVLEAQQAVNSNSKRVKSFQTSTNSPIRNNTTAKLSQSMLNKLETQELFRVVFVKAHLIGVLKQRQAISKQLHKVELLRMQRAWESSDI